MEYALYKEHNVLAKGTMEDIARKTGISLGTLQTYSSENYKSRLTANSKARYVVCLDGDECFAHNGRTCTVLKKMQCDNCAFYKTWRQVTEDRLAALRRIMKLDKDQIAYMFDKYDLKGVK